MIRTKNTDLRDSPKEQASQITLLKAHSKRDPPGYIKFPMGHWKVGITRHLRRASKTKIGAKNLEKVTWRIETYSIQEEGNLKKFKSPRTKIPLRSKNIIIRYNKKKLKVK